MKKESVEDRLKNLFKEDPNLKNVLALKFFITPGAINAWFRGGRSIPRSYVRAIEQFITENQDSSNG